MTIWVLIAVIAGPVTTKSAVLGRFDTQLECLRIRMIATGELSEPTTLECVKTKVRDHLVELE